MTRLGYLESIDKQLVPIDRPVRNGIDIPYQQPTSIPLIASDMPIPPAPKPERSTTTTKPLVKSSSVMQTPSNLPRVKGIEVTEGKVTSSYPNEPTIQPRTHLEVLLATFKQMLHLGYQAMEFSKVKCEEYGYTMDTELSTFDTYIYLNNETGFPLIVHRGSITASDWLIEDGLILSTLTDFISSPRSIYARRITRRVETKYKKPTDCFGHSLAGRLCEVSQANGYILTYNKAAGFQDIGKKINDKQYDFRTTNDIVSLLAQTQRSNTLTTIEDKGVVGSHALTHLSDEGIEIAQP